MEKLVLFAFNGDFLAVEKEGLPFLDEMSGHPSMTRYIDNG
jgi:hypothetical protein